MEIFLVGMPGSGKTTLGKQLSEVLNLKFIDLDQEIVDREGKAIASIFTEDGENYFRKLEASLLRKITENQKNFVMATGGGTPCFYDSMNFMNDSGISVYLKISINDLAQRVIADNRNERPLLKSESENEVLEKLTSLSASRTRYYETAHFEVDANETDLETLLVKISEFSKN